MLRNKDKGNPAKQLGPMQDDELSLDDLDKVVGGNAPVAQERREDEQIAHYEATMALASADPTTDGRTSREDAAPGRGVDMPYSPPVSRDVQYSAQAPSTPAASADQPHAPTMFAPPASQAPAPAPAQTFYPTETGRGDAGSSGERDDTGASPAPQADAGRVPEGQAPAPTAHVAEERGAPPPAQQHVAPPPAEQYVPPAPTNVAPPAPTPVTEERRGDEGAPTGTTPDQPAPVQNSREPEPPAPVPPTDPVPDPAIPPVVTTPTNTTPPPVTQPTTPTGTNQTPTGTTPTPTQPTGTTPTPTEGTGTTPTEGTGTTPTEGTGTTPTPTEGTGTTPTPTEGTGTTPPPTEGTGTTPPVTEGEGPTGTTPPVDEGQPYNPTRGRGADDPDVLAVVGRLAAGTATLDGAVQEIATLYQNGEVSDRDLGYSLISAVVSQTLTAEQAAELMAKIAAGDDDLLRRAVTEPMSQLIRDHQITGEQAIGMLVHAAVDASPAGQAGAMGELRQVGYMAGMNTGQVVDAVSQVIVSHAVTGAQGADLLASMLAGTWGDPEYKYAIGVELQGLMAQHVLAPADVVAAMHDAVVGGGLPSNVAMPMLLSAAEQVPGMQPLVLDEMAALLASGHLTPNTVTAYVQTGVFGHDVSALDAFTILDVLSASGSAGAQSAYDCLTRLINNGGITAETVIDSVHQAVIGDTMTGEAAVRALAGLSSRDPSWGPAFGGEIADLIALGELTATLATSAVHTVLSAQAISADTAVAMLVGMAIEGTPGVQAAVNAELALLIGQGATSGWSVAYNLMNAAAGGTDLGTMVDDLIAAGVVAPQEIVGLWINVSGEASFAALAAAGRDMIATLVEQGQISAGDVIDTIVRDISWPYSAMMAMTRIAGAGEEFSDAAAAGIATLISHGTTPNDVVNAVRSVFTAGVLTGEQAVDLLVGIGGSGAEGMMAAATVELSTMIGNGRIDVATAIGVLHEATVGQDITAEQAVTVLAGLAMRGDAGVQAAVLAEVTVLMASAQLDAGEVSDILRAVAATGTPAQQATLTSLLGSIDPAADPVEAVFGGVFPNATAAQLDAAADQLATLVSQGRVTAAEVVDDIFEAVAAQTLTAEQAASVLAGLAGHGGALAAAAATELGDLLSAQTISPTQAATAIRNAVAAASLTGDQAMAMLVSAAIDTDSRGLAMTVLAQLRTSQTVVLHPALTDDLFDRVAYQTLDGAQALEILAALGAADRGLAGYVEARITESLVSGALSPADLHAAVTHLVVTTDAAIRILSGTIAQADAVTDAAAISEIVAIAREGGVSAAVLMDRLSGSLSPDQRIMLALDFATTGDAAAQGAGISAIVGPINMGQMSPEQLAAGIGAAMSAQLLSGEQAIEVLAKIWAAGSFTPAAGVAIGEMALLVTSGAVDIDRAIGALAGAGELGAATAMLAAVAAAPGADAAEVLGHVGAAVAAQTLTADQALAILTGQGLNASAAAADRIEAGAAGAQIGELVNAGLLPRDAVISRLSTMTPADAAVGMLVVLAADATDAGTRNMAANGILSHVENGRISSLAAAEAIAKVAGSGDAEIAAAAGAQIARLVTGNLLTVASAMDAVHGYGGDAQLALLSTMAARGTYQLQTVAFDDISAMVADGRVTAAQAIRALSAAADLAAPEIQLRAGDAAAAAMRDAVAHEIGQLLVGDGTPAQQIANIHEAIVANAISGVQAAAILAEIAKSGSPEDRAAAIHEIGVLVADGEMTVAQAMAPINAAIADRTLQTWQALTLLSAMAVEPILLAAAGTSFADICASGLIPPANAISAIRFAVDDGVITPEQSVAMMVAVGASGRAGLVDAVATELSVMLNGTMTIERLMDAAAQGAVDGHLPAANVIAVLGAFAERQGDLIPDAVVNAIAAVAAYGHMSLADLSAAIWSATGTAPDITMFARTAAGSDAAVQAEFGVLAATWVQQGVMTATQMVERIHNAMVHNQLTGEQGLILLANMSAAVAATPGAYGLHQPIHSEIRTMIAFGEITDVQAVEVLTQLSANGSPELQAAADAELTLLMADQQILINVAGGGTPDEITRAATQLAAMINQGRATASAVMQDIVDARQAGHLTGEQAMVFLAAVVGAGTRDGWAVNTSWSESQSWLTPVGATVVAIVEAGMPADAAMDVIGRAVAGHRLTADQAVIMLAGVGTQPELQAAAAGEIATLIARGGIPAAQAAADVRAVMGPNLLPADQAVQLIARIAGAPDATSEIALAVGGALAAIPVYTMLPAGVADAVVAVAQAQGLGAGQVAALLAGMAAQGDSSDAAHAGAAVATLIADGVLSVGAVHGIVSDLPADKAVVVLAGMMAGSTVVQNTAMTEINALIAAGRITTAQVCAGLAAATATMNAGEGLGGLQAVVAMSGLPDAPEVATTIADLMRSGRVTGDVVQEVAAMAAAGSDQMQDNAARLIATAFGSDRGAIAASVIAGLEGLPVDRQIEFLAKLSDTTGFTGQSVACQGIAVILARGDAAPEQVVAEIRDTLAQKGRAGEAIELLVGVCAADPQVLRAAGVEIGRMMAHGEITAEAVADKVVDQDFFLRQVQGTGAEAVVTVLAAAMANSPTFTGRDAFQAEALHYATYGTTPEAMAAAIGDAIEAGGLPAVDGLRVLMLFGTAPVSQGGEHYLNAPQVNAAALDELVALLAAGKATPEQLVTASASSGPDATRLQAACGHVLGVLTANGQFTAEQVVNGVHNAVERNVLRPDQAVGMLAVLGDGNPDLQHGVTAEIGRMISSGAISADMTVRVLTETAKVGGASAVSAIGDQVALLFAGGQLTIWQAKNVLDSAVLSGAMSDQNAVLLLANAAGSGDAQIQVVAGGALQLLTTQTPWDTLAPSFRAAVDGGVLTAEDAALTIAGASQVPGFPATRMIGELVQAGKIGADAVMTLIHDAVAAGGLTAEQALKMLPAIADGSGSAAVRAAVPDAVCDLVRDGLVSGARAVEILMGHAPAGTPAFETLIGAEIGALVAAGLADPADVNAAMTNLRWTDGGAAFNVMLGQASAGPAAQQVAAESLLAIAQGDETYVIGAVSAAIASHRISADTGVGILVRCAAIGGERIDAAINATMVEMVQARTVSVGDLVRVAGATGAAEQAAVGEIIAHITAPNSGAIPGADAVAVVNNAITDGTLTAEQAMVVLMNGAATERGLGGWQVAAGTEAAISGMVQRGLEVNQAIGVMARIAGDGDAATQAVMGTVVNRLILAGQVSAADGVSAICGQANIRELTPDQVVAVLVGLAKPAVPEVECAVGKGINTMIAQGLIDVERAAMLVGDAAGQAGGLGGSEAVTILCGMSSVARPSMQDTIGAEIAELVSEGRISASAAMTAVTGFVSSGVLTLQQGLTLIPNIMVEGDATLRAAGSAAIATIIAGTSYTSGMVISTLLTTAGEGSAELQALIGEEFVRAIGSGRLDLVRTIEDIHAYALAMISPSEAAAVIGGMIAAGGLDVQGAAVAELLQLVSDGRLTAAQAVADVAAGLGPDHAIAAMVAIMVHGPDSFDAAAAAEISAMLGSGKVSVAQVMADVAQLTNSGKISQQNAVDVLADIAAGSYPGLPAAAGHAFAAIFPTTWEYGKLLLADAVAQLGNGEGGAHVVAMLAVIGGDKPVVMTSCADAVARLVAQGHPPLAEAAEGLVVAAARADDAVMNSIAAILSKLGAVGPVGAAVLAGTLPVADGLKLLMSIDGSPGLRGAAGEQLGLLVSNGRLSANQVFTAINADMDAGFQHLAELNEWDMAPETFYFKANAAASTIIYNAMSMLAGMAASDNEGTQDAAVAAMIAMAGRGNLQVPGTSVVLESAFSLDRVVTGVIQGLPAEDATKVLAELCIHVDPATTMRDPGLAVVNAREEMAKRVAGWVTSGGLDAEDLVDVIAERWTHSDAAQQLVLADMLGMIDAKSTVLTTATVAEEVRRTINSGDLTLDQGLTLLAAMSDQAVDRAAVGHVLDEIANDPGNSDARVMAVVTDVIRAGGLDLTSAATVIGGFVDAGGDAAVIGHAFAVVTLETWGVPTGSTGYDALLNALTQATVRFSAVADGGSVEALVQNLTQLAEASDLPVELMLNMVLLQAQALPAAESSHSRTVLTNAIRDSLTDGSFQNDVADLVASGRITAVMAEEMVETVAGGMWSVTAHPGVTTQQLVATAIDVLHVEMQVAVFAPQIISGQKTAEQAIDAITAACGTSRYAIDIGLAHLVDRLVVPPLSGDILHPELSGATAAEVNAAHAAHDAAVTAVATARNEVLQEIAGRMQLGDNAHDLVGAVDAGLLTSAAAVELMLNIAMVGRDGENATLVQTIALARLGEAAHGPLHDLLAETPAYVERMLAGVSALILLDPPGLAAHVAFARTLFADYIHATADLTNPNDVDEQGDKAAQWFQGAWWYLRDRNVVANTFGHTIALIADNPGSAESFESFMDFGANLATQGVPGQGLIGIPTVQGVLLNAAFTGATTGAPFFASGGAAVAGHATLEVPTWIATATGQYAPNAWLEGGASINLSPAVLFTIANVASKTLPMLLKMDAVADALGPTLTGGLNGACTIVSAACDMVTNTITGSVKAAGFMAYDALKNFGEAYNDLQMLAADAVFGGFDTDNLQESLKENSLQLAKAVVPLMYGGVQLDAMINAGVDTAKFTVDLLTGNFSNLEDSARAMGESFLELITTNAYVQIGSEQLLKFVSIVFPSPSEALDWYINALQSPEMANIARIELGLFTGETWERLGSVFEDIGDEIEDWFT